MENIPKSSTKEYRRKKAAERRKNTSALQVDAASNRKSYKRKINRLLSMQEGHIPDEEKAVEQFVKKRMLNGAKWRANRDGIEFSITLEDIILPAVCPISLRPMKLGTQGKESRDSYSLDRIDNTKGYTKDNIAVICREANGIKGAHEVEYFLRLIKYMTEKKNG